MAQTKATKKFEKHHLKDTLERRKGQKKIKQKVQLKAKQKARRAEENGGKIGEENAAAPATTNGRAKNAFQDMSVDDFFQGGFEVPDLPAKQKGGKRKRSEAEEEDGSGSEGSLVEEPVTADTGEDDLDSDSDDVDHKAQLDALAENDPEFHKYLQDNEPELLGGELAEIGDISDEEDGPKKKKQKKGQAADDDSDDEMTGAGKNELDMATVKRWSTAMSTQHSLRAAKEVVLAFRAAAHVSEDDDKKEFKYSISSPEVYHHLLTTALKHIPTVFNHHLPVQENQKTGKLHVPTESKKFKTLVPLLRSQITSIIHLLDNLSDPSTLRLTLTSTLPLLPYLLSFKKLIRDTARATATVWSSHSAPETTRIAAFLVLRRLIVIGDAGIRENVLKATYQALVKGARNTTVHTLPGVNLMKNSGAELWGLCPVGDGVAYTTAFGFIRQLAVHLRTSITNNSNESYKVVYNWQYIHSLDFWSRVLSSHAVETTSALRPLIYPLVQVTLGALRLIPTATYFPLRFHLVRSLLRISTTTGTYIPLAPALYEVLASAEMRKMPKSATLKPLDFATVIRAPKTYLRTRVYQDGVGEQVVELLGELFACWGKNIAFPELVLPVLILLRRWLKDAQSRVQGKGNKNQKVNTALTLLVQKLEANAKFIEEKRAKVEFSPSDRRGVEAFLKDMDVVKTPLGAYVHGQRKTREEKARLVEQGRVEEERRRVREKKRESKLEALGAEEESGEEEDDEEEDGSEVEIDGLEDEDEDEEDDEEDSDE